MREKLFLLLTSFAVAVARTEISQMDIAKIEDFVSQMDITEMDDVILPSLRDFCFGYNLANVSEDCHEQLNIVCENSTLLGVVLDASAKFPYSGLAYATRIDYGNFDQCMSIEHRYPGGRILGKYCTVGLVIPDFFGNVTDVDAFYKLAMCRPDQCSASDFNEMLRLTIDLPLFQDIFCQTAETEIASSTADVVTIGIISVCVALMVLSSLYDIYLTRKQLKSSSPLYLAFSVITNGRKLLQITKGTKEQIEILHGLRSISIMWIIAGHGFTIWQYIAVSNANDIEEWKSRPYAMYITTSRLAVDTFFFISGFLLAYQYLKQKPKPVMAHIRSVPQMYIHRYLRLTPAVLMTYLITISLIIHVGNGPLWTEGINKVVEPCRKYWWAFFLYIQNYYNYHDADLCLIPTWYLSTDMQLFLLSPLIIIPITFYLKKPSGFKWSMVQMFILCLVFIALPIALKIVFPSYDNEYDTHSRLITYFVGVTLGIFMRVKQDKRFLYMLNRENVDFTNLLFWTIVFLGMLTIVICHHQVENYHDYVSQTVFTALVRPAWCIGLSWIVYSCHHGYGGIINWILCIPVFQILGKLTYCMYLLHLLIMLYYAGTVRTRMYFSDYITFYQFCGHYLLTTFVAVFWTLAFESPLIVVEKIVLQRGSKGKKRENKPPKNHDIEEGQSNHAFEDSSRNHITEESPKNHITEETPRNHVLKEAPKKRTEETPEDHISEEETERRKPTKNHITEKVRKKKESPKNHITEETSKNYISEERSKRNSF